MEIWLQYTILIFVHFVSDWFLQPPKWAAMKTKKFIPLFLHSIQYSLVFVPVFILLKINLLWLLLLFFSHLAIDNYKFIEWWNKKVMKRSEMLTLIAIVQDQVLHFLVLIIPLIV